MCLQRKFADRLRKFAGRLFSSRPCLAALAAVNAAGFAYGLYYYAPQLAETNPLSWVFVIDSPLPVLLFSVICLHLLRGGRIPQFWAFFAAVGLVKAGVWTMTALAYFWPAFYTVSPLVFSLNFPLHAGMVAEGVILASTLRPKAWHALAVLAFFLLNDFLDYTTGTLTRIPAVPAWLAAEAVAASVLITLAFYKLAGRTTRRK